MSRVLALFALWILTASIALGAGRKISDYTETLELGEGWMYEIAVPGVTNYKVAFGTIASNIVARVPVTTAQLNTASNAVFASVITLNTNKADNNNGLVTNLTSRGLTLPALTAARSLFLNASGNITNVSGTPDGTKYVRDDGTYAVPSTGGGGPGSFGANANQFTTNVSLTIKDSALTTNLVVAGVGYIDGILTAGGTNIASFMGSNYFGGRVQIASGVPGVGKVLTSDVDGNATWETGGAGEVTTAQLNTASNTLSARIVSNDTTTSNGLVNLMSSSGSTQVVVAAFGNVTVTNTLTANTLSVVTFHANSMTLTNPMGSNQVRMGYQDLTNVLRRQTFFAPAGYMISNTTDGATFVTEQGAPPTNRMSDRYVFSGTITNVVEFETVMPENWDLSTVKVKLWTTSTNNIATTTNVWGISASALKHGSTITNVNWGTEVLITNVVSSAGGQSLVTPATPALTVGNSPAAAGNLVGFRIRRLPGHPDDNDDGQQKLLGAWVKYGETMAEVAAW